MPEGGISVPDLAVLLVYYMLHLYALCTGVFKCVSFILHMPPHWLMWLLLETHLRHLLLLLFWLRWSTMTTLHLVWLETACLKVVIHKGRYYHIFT